jgi:hypothetical protein
MNRSPETKAAAARTPIYLIDGRSAVLVCWKQIKPVAKVFVDGRHTWVDKADVVWPTGALEAFQ